MIKACMHYFSPCLYASPLKKLLKSIAKYMLVSCIVSMYVAMTYTDVDIVKLHVYLDKTFDITIQHRFHSCLQFFEAT